MGKANDAAVELPDYNAPDATGTLGTTPSARDLGLPANVPPEAIQAALEQIAKGEVSPGTPSGQQVAANTPNTPAVKEGQPEQQSPFGAPVDLDALLNSPGRVAAPVAQPSATNTTQTNTNGQAAQPVAQQPAQPMEPRVVDLTDPNAMIRMADGRTISVSELQGEIMLKGKFSREKQLLQEKERNLDQQMAIVSKIASDPFGAAYTAAINAGVQPTDAVKAGLAAMGVTQAQTPAEAVPEWPNEDDPNYGQKVGQFIAHQAKSAIAPDMRRIEDRLIQQEQSSQRVQAQAQAVTEAEGRIVAANNDLFKMYVEPLMPNVTTPEQVKIVGDYLVAIGEREGIPVDTNSYKSRAMSASDVRLLAKEAFPNGQLPDALKQQLGIVTNGNQQQTQQPYVPQNGGAPVQQQPAAIPSVIQNWEKLAPELRQAIITQVAINQAAAAQNAQATLGSTYGNPPGIPQTPVLNAGPNVTAIHVAPMAGFTGARPETHIAQQMGALKYKD